MMDEDELMKRERAATLEADEELEALIALIEDRVIEKLTRIFEQIALERDFSR